MNRIAIALILSVTCFAASAQTTPGETSAAPSEPPAEGTTITIDPTVTPGISLDSPAAPEDNFEEQGGPVGRMLEDAVPDTGNAAVDTSVDKLSQAVSGLIDGFIKLLPQLVIALFVIIIAALAARLAAGVIRRFGKKARMRGSLIDLFVLFGRVAVWFAAIMTAAGIIFPSFGFAQLVATAGLASIAIGFAFQDIFENFFAGILILWRFPFENGDFIEVDGLMGKVEDVEIRSTSIRRTNGELVIVPNSTIFKNNVTVLTNRAHRRLELAVGIAYGEDVAEGRRVILEAVKSCDTVQNDAKPEVLATAFGASSIDFDVIWWCDSKPIDTRRSRDQVVEAIKKALDDAGIEIPYPYRTLTFSKNEPDIIEAFAGRGGGGATGGGESQGEGQ